MIAIIYRLGPDGPETFRRFGGSQHAEVQAMLAAIQPRRLVGLVSGGRAETCRPGHPRGDEEAGPLRLNPTQAELRGPDCEEWRHFINNCIEQAALADPGLVDCDAIDAALDAAAAAGIIVPTGIAAYRAVQTLPALRGLISAATGERRRA